MNLKIDPVIKLPQLTAISNFFSHTNFNCSKKRNIFASKSIDHFVPLCLPLNLTGIPSYSLFIIFGSFPRLIAVMNTSFPLFLKI